MIPKDIDPTDPIRIYAIYVNPKKIRYIGQTHKRLTTRLKAHIRTGIKKSQPGKFYAWVRKMIEQNKEIKIKQLCFTEYQYRLDIEKYYIHKLKEEGNPILNLTHNDWLRILGTRKGTKHSEESREKMRQGHARKNRKGPDCPNSKGVYGEIEGDIKEFACAREAAEFLQDRGIKCSSKNIGAVLANKRKSAGGIKWFRE